MTSHTPIKILVGVAWPYAQGPLHIGHIAGAYLPPDIFARYHRSIGDDVLMVSGSDVHGTPIMVKADELGVSPKRSSESITRSSWGTGMPSTSNGTCSPPPEPKHTDGWFKASS